MKYLPENDGIDHINIYSKGKTELGRFLSNFAKVNIVTEDGPFSSIEGYWYWLSTKDDQLRVMAGFLAKKIGRELGGKDWVEDSEFKRKISAAIEIKINTNPDKKALLLSNQLPLVHYYNYCGKVVEVKEGEWILNVIRNIK